MGGWVCGSVVSEWVAGRQADRPCLAVAVDTHSVLMHS